MICKKSAGDEDFVFQGPGPEQAAEKGRFWSRPGEEPSAAAKASLMMQALCGG
jgi:hypothetical protein